MTTTTTNDATVECASCGREQDARDALEVRANVHVCDEGCARDLYDAMREDARADAYDLRRNA